MSPMLEPIGEVEDLDSLDFEPLTIPIVGYTLDKERVVTEIRFASHVAPGMTLDLVRTADENGNIRAAAALNYIDACVLDEDRETFDYLMHRKDVIVTEQTVAQVYRALTEFYANRPTNQRSGSRGGRSNTRRTSQGAVSATASRKKGSR